MDELRARKGVGVLKKLCLRNQDGTQNKEEKCWYSWMKDGARTDEDRAEMETLNVLVNATVSRKRVRVKSGAVAGSIETIAGYQRCGGAREEAAVTQVGSFETVSPEMRKARRVAEAGGGDESRR